MKTPEQIRLESGLDQKQLADRAGVGASTVGRIERGEVVKLRAVTIEKIGMALMARFEERKTKFTLPEYIEIVLAHRDKVLRELTEAETREKKRETPATAPGF